MATVTIESRFDTDLATHLQSGRLTSNTDVESTRLEYRLVARTERGDVELYGCSGRAALYGAVKRVWLTVRDEPGVPPHELIRQRRSNSGWLELAADL